MSSLKPCKRLGFGFMRLPKNSEGNFDMPLIKNMVDKFLEKGFTYFDTAYVYEGSELAMSEALVKRHPRDSYTIADKMPVFLIDKPEKTDILFKETLSRLGTDYVDYYLVHGLDGKKSIEAEELGVWDYIAKKKEEGAVKHMGFSFHGTADELDDILTRHPEAEFCQLQINYLDWESDEVQSRRCYEVARKHNTPIMIMEPVKGGLLAAPDAPAAGVLKKYNAEASVASWAIRFAAGLEGVHVCLSGMNSMAMLEDNMASCDPVKQISEAEKKALDEAAEATRAVPTVQCTGCSYCTADCPQKIQIPTMMNCYNTYIVFNSTENVQRIHDMTVARSGKAGDCVECGACEGHCPQHLNIREILKKVAEIYE